MKLSQAAHNIEKAMRSPTSTSFDTSADEVFLRSVDDDIHPKDEEPQESWEQIIMRGAAPRSWQGTSSSRHHPKDHYYHSPSWKRQSTNPHGTTKGDPKHHHPDSTDHHHHKNGILHNNDGRDDDHPTLVPCRHESKEATTEQSSGIEPDVGILLNCPSGTTCRRRVGAVLSDGTSSESEGLCIPNLSLQQDYPQSVEDHRMLDQQASSDYYYGSLLFCTEEGSSFWDNYYYGCDCSAFDTEAQQGSFSCEMYDYYCFGRNGHTTGERTSSTHQQPCGSLTLQRTLDGTYETSEYCYTLTNQHHLDEPMEICYAYSTEGITDNGVGECSISIDGVTCQSCYIPTDGVEVYEGGRVLYGCFAFDCTNTPVALEGVDCLGDYVMEAVASGDGDDHLDDPTPAPTLHWTRAPTRAPTAHPATKSPVTTAPPTESPSDGPSSGPSISPSTTAPTTSPSTASPTTSHPSLRPSHSPTASPSMGPTGMPSSTPSSSPTTARPSSAPSMTPTDGISTRLDDTTGENGIGIDLPTTPEESSPVPSSQPTDMSAPSTSSPSTTSSTGDEAITDRTEPSPPTKAPTLSPTEDASAASPHAGNSKRYGTALLAIGVGGLLLL